MAQERYGDGARAGGREAAGGRAAGPPRQPELAELGAFGDGEWGSDEEGRHAPRGAAGRAPERAVRPARGDADAPPAGDGARAIGPGTPPAARRRTAPTRDVKISLRFEEAEERQLRADAEGCGEALAQYMRRTIMEARRPAPRHAASAFDQQAYGELTRYRGDMRELLDIARRNRGALPVVDMGVLNASLAEQLRLLGGLLEALDRPDDLLELVAERASLLMDRLHSVERRLDVAGQLGVALHELARPDERLDRVVELLGTLTRRVDALARGRAEAAE